MQENEFEKQIKQAMDGYRVLPSESVWENVKKHLIKRKRRLLPFLLVFAMLAVGGYAIYNFQYSEQAKDSNKQKTATASSLSKTNSLNQKQKEIIVDKRLNDQQKNNPDDKYKNNVTTQSSLKITAQQKKVTDETASASSNQIKNTLSSFDNCNHKKNNTAENSFLKNNESEQNNSATQTSTIVTANISPVLPNEQNQTVNQSSNTKDTALTSTKSITAQQDQVNSALNNADNKQPLLLNDSTQKNLYKTLQANNKKSKFGLKDLRQSKWSFGVTAIYGISNISSFSGFNSEKSYSTNATSDPAYQGQGRAVIKLDHPYKSFEAYKFGIVVQRQLFKNGFLNTGLNYVHLSAKSIVATNTTSAIVLVAPALNNFAASYYQLGTQEVYNSNYNFIELPLTFQSSIFSTKKISFNYNAGTSIRKLISSTPLIYNNSNNTFSKEKNLLKQTQLQLSAGLLFQLQLKNNAFSIGPQLDYSVSKFAQTNNFHYLNYGLQAKWLFGRK